MVRRPRTGEVEPEARGLPRGDDRREAGTKLVEPVGRDEERIIRDHRAWRISRGLWKRRRRSFQCDLTELPAYFARDASTSRTELLFRALGKLSLDEIPLTRRCRFRGIGERREVRIQGGKRGLELTVHTIDPQRELSAARNA